MEPNEFDCAMLLGESHAFGLVAGRCSAAQAAGIQRLREEKLYLAVTPHWRDFCPKYLHMSASQADRIIRLLDEFGSGYFELAELTRISAETYRAIAPSVQDNALHVNGEAIELKPENARKVAAAVAELRRALPAGAPQQPVEMHQRLAQLDRKCTAMLAEFEEISRKERRGENWLQFTATLTRMRSSLARIEAENGL